MVSVQGEILIDRRPEEIFDFVADEENEPRYNPDMRYAKKRSDGPIGVGTRFEATMTGRGRLVPMTIQLTEYDRPRRLSSDVHMEAMDLTGGLTFEPVDGGTRMSWSWDLQPHGFLRFMGPLVATLGRRMETRIWTGLKHLLEAEKHQPILSPDRPRNSTHQLTDWLFEHAAAERVQAPTDPANVVMCAVFEWIGWEFVGTLSEFGREWMMYAVTRKEWQARRA